MRQIAQIWFEWWMGFVVLMMMMRNLPRKWWLSSRALTFATESKSWLLQFHSESNTASWWCWRWSLFIIIISTMNISINIITIDIITIFIGTICWYRWCSDWTALNHNWFLSLVWQYTLDLYRHPNQRYHHHHTQPHHRLHHHHRHHQKWFLVCCFPRDLDPLTTQLSWEKNKETARGKKWKKSMKRFSNTSYI